jgi:D-alanyl-D-alanine carboxypeptidase
MPTTVNFNPASIDCGVIPPGGTSIGSTRCEVLSAPVNVTASISHDTSGGALTLLSVKSFITETQLEVPDPGELPPGTKPPPPVKVQVPVQQGQSNGVTPLAVVSGQYVEVNIQFAPTASTPDTSTATLLISGDTWNPVSIPIGANVGELAVSVPSIRVKSGWSATVEVTVKSVAGPKTTAKLIPYTSLPTEVPNVTVTPPSSSLSIGKGQSVTAKFTVSADVSPGSYDWAIGVWAFDNAQSFSVPVPIIVEYALSQYAVQEIDQLVTDFLANRHIPGLMLAIQHGGKTVYERGYGTVQLPSNPKATPDPAPGPDTHFQIDSLTKVFTAIAVLKLAEDGKVDLDEKMGNYLNLANANWEPIPVRSYLGMITGIPDLSALPGQIYQDAIDSAAAAHSNSGLDFTPGSQYEYSNVNYFILGNLICAVSPEGEALDPLCRADALCRAGAYADYIKSIITGPLGMSDTGLIDFESGDQWATPYINGAAQSPRLPLQGFSGGGLVTTMGDLEKLATALHERKILSAKSYQRMWSRTVLTSGNSKGSSINFGLGWDDVAFDSNGNLVRVTKNGGGWGWGSQLNYYPEEGKTVIVLCNGPGAIGSLAGSVHDLTGE